MHPLLLPAAALLILGLWLTFRLVQASRARSLAHASYFDAVKPLFSDLREVIQPTGFPRLSGRHFGLGFDLQAVPDTLTFRKLPALWVMLTLPEVRCRPCPACRPGWRSAATTRPCRLHSFCPTTLTFSPTRG